MSKADANQAKLIQAHDTAKVAKQKPTDPDPHVVLDQRVRELVGRGAEGDHEREVEEQLERGRGPVDLGHVAAGHPDDAVRLVGHGGILGIPRCRPGAVRRP